MTSRVVLRRQLAEELRERIDNGELHPGDRLPSEPDLARQLGVSRSSLRAAITLLEEDGFVRRLHGSGTYVTHRPLLPTDLGRNFGVSTLIASTGMEPGVVDVQFRTEPADDNVAEGLGVDRGELVSVLHRVRTAGGRRVVATTDWCRVDDLTAGELGETAQRSVYAALAERGIAVHHGVASITPDVADTRLAELLDVPRGALLLTVWQVDQTADGRPALVSREHYLADALAMTVYRRGPATDDEP